MIDIIEAGKFYNDCLKKVHESILQENVLPENKAINAIVALDEYAADCSGRETIPISA